MQLVEVTDSTTAKQFIQVNVRVNQNNDTYIRPLDQDIEGVFNAAKNKAFRFGEVIRWILKDEENTLIGRIAAFTNKKYKNKGDDVRIGGIGFFDCINSHAAAEMLFDVAKHWLIQKGMEAMDGPINFGERDRWWGLLVKGFDPPLYCMNYNPPYYQNLFEQYGFKPFFNQICFALKIRGGVQEKFHERYAKISGDPAFRVDRIKKNQLKKYAVDFSEIYNKAWGKHGGLKEMHPDQVYIMFKQMKPIMDERIIWFIYHNDVPIAMWANMPDLNQWFKYLDGNFNWLGKLKFLWIKATKKCTKISGLVFGVIPEYHKTGVHSYLIVQGEKILNKETHYEDLELQWIGDFNPVMINVAESLGGYRSRELITYRYLFDRNKEFKRHPVLS